MRLPDLAEKVNLSGASAISPSACNSAKLAAAGAPGWIAAGF
jgi:hypothetical protein